MRPDWFRPTLRARLTMVYGGLFLVAGVVLVGLSYVFVSSNLPGGARSNTVQFKVLNNGNGQVTAQLDETLSGTPVELADGSVGIRLADGNVITPAQYRAQVQETIQGAIEKQREDTLSSLLQQSALALGLVAVGALGAGWLVAGRALRPLHVITGTARKVADRSLHERIALEGPPDELKELADTFDDMLERLDRAFAGQSRFVANASHELRTPLAVNRTLLEVAMSDPAASSDLRQVGSSLLTVNERSERLIDGLLLLARSENVVAERKPIDLADAARHAVGQLAQAAEDASVTIRPQLTPAVALGDPVLLERLVTNLVENAIRHNVPGGWAEVATGRAPGTGHPQLVVSNGGEQIPPYEVEELFEPFRRLRGERTADSRGSGLGLSIVRSIVAAHGGSVHAEARADGGLVVRVTLPR
jgi:signal transduction histidine kinase